MSLSGCAALLAEDGAIVELEVGLTRGGHGCGSGCGTVQDLANSTGDLAAARAPGERSLLMDKTIGSVLAKHARCFVEIEKIGVHDDLYQMGMTSHATVNVMLARR